MNKLLLSFFLLILLGMVCRAQSPQLWGMTPYGSTGPGIVFKMNEDGSAFKKVVAFNGANGAYPMGSFIQGADGKLYGTTFSGGANELGALFTIDFPDSVSTVVYSFDSATGCYPNGSLIQAANGKLYGLAMGGGLPFGGTDTNYAYKGNGCIYSFNISSATYTDEYDFHYTDGAQPHGSLIQGTDGKLYGMTWLGGNDSTQGGVIFSFDPGTKEYHVLHEFTESTGQAPYGSLIQASNGMLYGMAWNGGSAFLYNDGVLFSYDLHDSIYTNLVNFDGSNGGQPIGNLVEGADHKLYGMTSEQFSGSAYNLGNIFTYDPIRNYYDDVYEINYLDTSKGDAPQGSLIQAANGMFYGMMTHGGTASYNKKGCGVVFKFDPANNPCEVLHQFNSDSDGAFPTGDLLEVNSLVTGAVAATLCAGTTIQLPFTVANDSAGSNTLFIAQLSDSTGSFNAPDSIGSVLGILPPSNFINATIPINTLQGNGYRIRIISRNPALTGLTNKLNIRIGKPAGDFTIANQILEPPADSVVFTNTQINFNLNYMWLFGDSTADTTNDITVSHVYKKPGVYDVALVVYNNEGGCYDTILKKSEVQFLTGIEQVSINNYQLSVYPNPTSGIITIASSKVIDELKVTNLLGQLMYDVKPQQSQYNLNLNTEGIYFVTVTSENSTTTKKVVVSR